MSNHSNVVQDERRLTSNQCMHHFEYGRFDEVGLATRIGLCLLEKKLEDRLFCSWRRTTPGRNPRAGTCSIKYECTCRKVWLLQRNGFIKNRGMSLFQADTSRFEWWDPPHRIGGIRKDAYTDLRSGDAHPRRHCCGYSSSKWVSCGASLVQCSKVLKASELLKPQLSRLARICLDILCFPRVELSLTFGFGRQRFKISTAKRHEQLI